MENHILSKNKFIRLTSALIFLAVIFPLSLSCGNSKSDENRRSSNSVPTIDSEGNPASNPNKTEIEAIMSPEPYFPLKEITRSSGLRRLTNAQYGQIIKKVTAQTADISKLPLEITVRNLSTDSSTLQVIDAIHQKELLQIATNAAAAMNLSLFPCATTVCTKAEVSAFVRAASSFSMPDEDVQRYVDLYNQVRLNISSNQGKKAVAQALLTSPYVLYRVEIGSNGSLTARELAWKLSYFLWGEAPDAPLMASVADNSLLNEKTYQDHILRMLANPKAAANFPRFINAWLGLDKIDLSKIPAAQGLSPNIQKAMFDEVALLTEDVLFNRNLGLGDLLRADYTFMNSLIGNFYGIPVSSSEFVKVNLDKGDRMGLLTTPLVLAAHSKESGRSPIQRGSFIVNQLLCLDFPPEAGTASTVLPGSGDSLRERLALLEKVRPCSNCHMTLNSGFAFEQFDGLGRQVEPGLPDEEVLGILRLAGRPTLEMQGAVDAVKKLAATDELQRCFVAQLYRWAQGRMPGTNDHEILNQLNTGFKAKNQNVNWLLQAIAQSSEFKTSSN